MSSVSVSPVVTQGLLSGFFSGMGWIFTNSVRTDSFLLPCSQVGDFLPPPAWLFRELGAM